MIIRAALAALLVIVAAFPAAADTLKIDDYPIAIEYAPSNRRVATKVQHIIEREVPTLTAQLGLQYMHPIEVRVESDITPYRVALGRSLPTWGVAFAVLEDQVIVVDVKRATRALGELDHVIPHELSHLFLAQRVPRVHFPVWFLEGLAQWQAGEWSMIDSWQLMNAVWGGDVPNLMHMVDQYPAHEERARTGYRLAYAAVSDLFADHPENIAPFLDTVAKMGNFDQAFSQFFGVDVPNFTVAFHRHLETRYHSPLLVFQTVPLFSILALLFLATGIRYYLYKRRRLREMDALEGDFRQ